LYNTNAGKMNKFLLSFLLATTFTVAAAQKVYFIYLQSESEQPFYLKMNTKLQSSSASGYLIVPKLLDSTYTFTIGFPQNKWPEQVFTVAVNRKDQGFLLKNFGEKGWGLFNLQTMTILMSTGAGAANSGSAVEQNREVSAFTETLSKAAGDPSLKEKPVQPVIEDKKAEPVAETVKQEPVILKPAEVITAPVIEKKGEPKTEMKEDPKIEVKAQPVTEIKEEQKIEIKEPPKTEIKEQPIEKAEEIKTIPPAEYKMAVVTKRSESSTTEGFGLVYLVNYDAGITDTVRLLIPNPKPMVMPVKEEVKEEKKMLDIPVEVVKAEEKPEEIKTITAPVTVVAETKPAIKTHCPDIAAETDFFKLRKLMAAADSDDQMIGEAKKYFKTKCFTTSQIKNLGALFLTDEGKYTFYDAAYSHTSDAENFGSLQTELKEEYYINRFRAMLRN
jgi:hypothetical protein